MQIRVGFLLLWVVFACTDGEQAASVGQGGSLARFAIQGSYIYVISNSTLETYEIAGAELTLANRATVGFAMETIVARDSYLYLGARDAMYIYSIAQPKRPEFVFRYQHITSCDPVVVQGNRAYVTLRSGNMCNMGVNALEIIDITNPNSPKLITNYRMNSPGGLGISGDCLFVCEGESGLKWLNVKDDRVRVVQELNEYDAYDVIVGQGELTLTGLEGVYQFSFDCVRESLSLLSAIPVVRAEF
jgi:hypothetical protein